MKWVKLLCVTLLFVMLTFSMNVAPTLAADKFPSKPITMIDPWPPGGSADIVGRILASVAQEYLGQPLVMKYRAGAAGVRGSEAVSRADADGYTMGILGFGAIINQVVAYPKRAPYKKDDFVFICQMSSNPCVLVANEEAPFKTLKEMIKYVKANPSKVVYSTSGRFGFVHTGFARLIKAAGLEGKMLHLPTKGGAGAAKECLGGHSMVTGGTTGVVLPHIASGSFVPLAVCLDKRMPELPKVPTVSELLGVKVGPTTFWTALCVPKGTPSDRVKLLRVKFAEVLKDKSVIKLFKRTGARLVCLTGEQMQKKWDDEWKSGKELVSVLLEK